MDVDVPRRLPFAFSVDVWDEGVTDQGESLRCWAFASLNVVRTEHFGKPEPCRKEL